MTCPSPLASAKVRLEQCSCIFLSLSLTHIFCTTHSVICRKWDLDSKNCKPFLLAKDHGIICTNGIRRRVSINTFERYPRWTPIHTPLTSWLTLDRHFIDTSVESRSRYPEDNRPTIDQLLIDCWSIVYQVSVHRVSMGLYKSTLDCWCPMDISQLSIGNVFFFI